MWNPRAAGMVWCTGAVGGGSYVELGGGVGGEG